jgi:hypothetical protein
MSPHEALETCHERQRSFAERARIDSVRGRGGVSRERRRARDSAGQTRHERLAGIAQARQEGRPHGRPATVRRHADNVRKLHQEGVSKSEIARRQRQPNLSPAPLGALAYKNFRFLRSPQYSSEAPESRKIRYTTSRAIFPWVARAASKRRAAPASLRGNRAEMCGLRRLCAHHENTSVKRARSAGDPSISVP